MPGRIGKFVARIEKHLTLARHRRTGRKVVHLLHIGKTGGSAVKVALEPQLVTERYAVALHPHHTVLRDIRPGDGVIFFLRDPLTRYVSGFYSRQRKGQPRSFSEWTPQEKEAFEHFSTPNELALALSSGDADRCRRAKTALQSIRHVRDSYWKWFESEAYFRSRLSDVCFIGHQESLSADFETLKRMLGLPEAAALPSDPVRAHKNPEKLDYRLDEAAVKNLQHWYRDEWKFIELCRSLIEVPRAANTKAA